MQEMPIKPFTPDSAKSKMDKFSKFTNWLKLENSTTVMYYSTAFQLMVTHWHSVHRIKWWKNLHHPGLTMGMKGLNK